MKILLVEDDKWLAESLACTIKNGLHRISPGRHEIETVSSPDEAIVTIDVFRPNVIVLDMMLGDKNGLVLVNELQSYTDTMTIPVIVLSSSAKQINQDDLGNFGIRKIIDKADTCPDEIVTACINLLNEGELCQA